MSTVDPDAARRLREQRIPTGRHLVAPALVAFIVPALATAALVRMITNAAENDAFDGASVLALVLAFPGTGATIFAVICWSALSHRNPALPGLSAPLGLAVLGIAGGLSVSASPPAWVRAPQPTVPVMILLVAGLGILGGSAWLRRRRLRERAREGAIMRASAPVTGIVTNQGYTMPDAESSSLLTTVTYAFADAAGDRRYVRKREHMPMNDLVVDGEKVDLWYDRDDPSEENDIVVRRRPLASGRR